jgi:hypothetical protein
MQGENWDKHSNILSSAYRWFVDFSVYSIFFCMNLVFIYSWPVLTLWIMTHYGFSLLMKICRGAEQNILLFRVLFPYITEGIIVVKRLKAKLGFWLIDCWYFHFQWDFLLVPLFWLERFHNCFRMYSTTFRENKAIIQECMESKRNYINTEVEQYPFEWSLDSWRNWGGNKELLGSDEMKESMGDP